MRRRHPAHSSINRGPEHATGCDGAACPSHPCLLAVCLRGLAAADPGCRAASYQALALFEAQLTGAAAPDFREMQQLRCVCARVWCWCVHACVCMWLGSHSSLPSRPLCRVRRRFAAAVCCWARCVPPSPAPSSASPLCTLCSWRKQVRQSPAPELRQRAAAAWCWDVQREHVSALPLCLWPYLSCHLCRPCLLSSPRARLPQPCWRCTPVPPCTPLSTSTSRAGRC